MVGNGNMPFLKILNDASLESLGFLMWKFLECIICKKTLWVGLLSCKVGQKIPVWLPDYKQLPIDSKTGFVSCDRNDPVVAINAYWQEFASWKRISLHAYVAFSRFYNILGRFLAHMSKRI